MTAVDLKLCLPAPKVSGHLRLDCCFCLHCLHSINEFLGMSHERLHPPNTLSHERLHPPNGMSHERLHPPNGMRPVFSSVGVVGRPHVLNGCFQSTGVFENKTIALVQPMGHDHAVIPGWVAA